MKGIPFDFDVKDVNFRTVGFECGSCANNMESLAAFRPYLAGPVLKGTAGRYADIDLQLFTDDHKAVELFLLNRDVPYETSEARHYCGDEPRAVPVLRLEWEGVPLNLAVYASNDERATLKATPTGRPIERAGISAVDALLQADAQVPARRVDCRRGRARARRRHLRPDGEPQQPPELRCSVSAY